MENSQGDLRMYYQRMKKAFFNLSLTSKLKYIYTALIFLCISCNLLILYGFFSREMQKTLSTLTSQTVETVSRNVDSSLSVISKTSTYLLGTAEVQNYLQDINHSEYAILSKQLRNFLYLTMESMPLASSIIVMQPSGAYEGAARYALPSITMDSPEDASWYEELCEKKGAPILTVNADGYQKLCHPDPPDQQYGRRQASRISVYQYLRRFPPLLCRGRRQQLHRFLCILRR